MPLLAYAQSAIPGQSVGNFDSTNNPTTGSPIPSNNPAVPFGPSGGPGGTGATGTYGAGTYTAGTIPSVGGGTSGSLTLAGIVNSIIRLTQYIVPALAAAAVVFFLFGIVKYMYAVAQGSREQSKDIMLWGLLSLFVIFSMWGILSVIQKAFFGS